MASIHSISHYQPIKDCDPFYFAYAAVEVGEVRGWRVFKHKDASVFWAQKPGASTGAYTSREALNLAIPDGVEYLSSALFDELAGASDLLDKGHDPILVAKLLITSLQELVSLNGHDA